MNRNYEQPPDFNDKTKWLELEAKREVIRGANESGIIVPIFEKRYYREIQCGRNGNGTGFAYVFFNREAALINWNYPTENGNGHVGYFALRLRSGKWAISNMTINGVTTDNPNIPAIQVYVSKTEIWIIFKAKKGWCMRKIKKLP